MFRTKCRERDHAGLRDLMSPAPVQLYERLRDLLSPAPAQGSTYYM
jgi:hypothetical protein